MKTVGELFASGEMQLPFVLQSAETMKAAVSYLEPKMEKADQGGKGTIVLATVKGDVHDIGKNLVDIILTNNGYEVVNLGIKVGITEMLQAAEEHKADAIGMSGLLVKSTLIMRENLEEMNARGLAHIPVILGGAALTRTYVERDLRQVYDGRLFYGKDAFEGLRTMDRLVELIKSGRGRPRVRPRASAGGTCRPRKSQLEAVAVVDAAPAAVARGGQATTPSSPRRSSGSRVAKGIALDDIAAYLNLTALFRNQWGYRPEEGRGRHRLQGAGRAVSCARSSTRPRPRTSSSPRWPGATSPPTPRATTSCCGPTRPRRTELQRFTFPRQNKEPWLCIADFFRPVESGELDYAAFQLVTMGSGRLGGGRRALRRGPLHRVPPPPRTRGGDGRGPGRVLAPPHPRGMGLRRRGRPQPHRPLPPAVPGRPLLVGLPGLPQPRGQRQGGRPPRRLTGSGWR